jgi:hypothetical protein
MKITNVLLFLLVIVFFSSCTSDKYIFSKENFYELKQLKITDAITLEQKRSVDVSPNQVIGLGEGIYPNKRRFILTGPRVFKASDKEFEIETDYFYTAEDSSVKVILYQWDKTPPQKDALLSIIKPESNLTAKYQIFQKKFNQLSKKLTKILGEPTEVNLEQNKMDTFRDDIKWSKNGLNAYMFMFGNNNGYRQIRLAIYAE